MAVFGIRMKKRDKAVGGFHAQYIDKTPKKKRASLGIARTFGSATTLIIGGRFGYTKMPLCLHC